MLWKLVSLESPAASVRHAAELLSADRRISSAEAEAEFQKAMQDHMFRTGILRTRATRQENVMNDKLMELIQTFRADQRLSVLFEGDAPDSAGV
jgi:hypothetical protein